MKLLHLCVPLSIILTFWPKMAFSEFEAYRVCPFPGAGTTEGIAQSADVYMEYWRTNDPDTYYDELVDTAAFKSSILRGETIIYMNDLDGQWKLTTFSLNNSGFGLLVSANGCPSVWPPPKEEPKKEEEKTDLVPFDDSAIPKNCVLEENQVTCESPSGEKITTNCQDTPDLCDLARGQTAASPAEQDPNASTGLSPVTNPSVAPSINALGTGLTQTNPPGIIQSGLLPSDGQANFDGNASSTKGPMMLASLPDEDDNHRNPNVTGPGTLPGQEAGTKDVNETSKKLSQAATNEKLWMSNPPSQLVKYAETSSSPSRNPLTRLKESVDRFLSCFDDENAARLSGDSALGCISREIFGW